MTLKAGKSGFAALAVLIECMRAGGSQGHQKKAPNQKKRCKLFNRLWRHTQGSTRMLRISAAKNNMLQNNISDSKNLLTRCVKHVTEKRKTLAKGRKNNTKLRLTKRGYVTRRNVCFYDKHIFVEITGTL